MKASVLIDEERPKARMEDVAKILKEAGMTFVRRDADFDIVVGGDGVFSYYGRIRSTPLLFVKTRSRDATGSKGYLSEVYLDQLKKALVKMRQGDYKVEEYKRLEVFLDGASLGEIFTDAYLQRGADSNCIRYKLTSTYKGSEMTDFAISDGVVVCTSSGSTGYYSYLDKLRSPKQFVPDRSASIGKDEVGICHIVPIYTSREGTSEHPLRYTVPWGTEIRIELVRDADARIYAVGRSRTGIRVRLGSIITIKPSRHTTRIVRFD